MTAPRGSSKDLLGYLGVPSLPHFLLRVSLCLTRLAGPDNARTTVRVGAGDLWDGACGEPGPCARKQRSQNAESKTRPVPKKRFVCNGIADTRPPPGGRGRMGAPPGCGRPSWPRRGRGGTRSPRRRPPCRTRTAPRARGPGRCSAWGRREIRMGGMKGADKGGGGNAGQGWGEGGAGGANEKSQ